MRLINNLFQQIDGKSGEGTYGALLQPVASHAIYKAHFPDNPITPGVCLIQVVGEVLEQMIGKQVSLRTVDTAKFLHVVEPIENHPVSVEIESVKTDDDALLQVKASIHDADTVCAKFSLRFSLS